MERNCDVWISTAKKVGESRASSRGEGAKILVSCSMERELYYLALKLRQVSTTVSAIADWHGRPVGGSQCRCIDCVKEWVTGTSRNVWLLVGQAPPSSSRQYRQVL